MWHSLAVWREGSMVTALLDTTHQYQSTSASTYTQINDSSGLVYIGGFPGEVGVRQATGGEFQTALVGCVRDLSLHRSPRPLTLTTLTLTRDLHPCL
ncbi:hypothetical protein Pmani_009084 [Petrolisthes manimaculis]|uniref:Laminin G domain-containing protein n=1 Tax=Petrolisthes manimaculis TaxID=1843537 RepID=A0AAE1UI96_9EUCA|nr:hypothetical protein Pmani_009084 [Petrolisthes manimaculis]